MLHTGISLRARLHHSEVASVAGLRWRVFEGDGGRGRLCEHFSRAVSAAALSRRHWSSLVSQFTFLPSQSSFFRHKFPLRPSRLLEIASVEFYCSNSTTHYLQNLSLSFQTEAVSEPRHLRRSVPSVLASCPPHTRLADHPRWTRRERAYSVDRPPYVDSTSAPQITPRGTSGPPTLVGLARCDMAPYMRR